MQRGVDALRANASRHEHRAPVGPVRGGCLVGPRCGDGHGTTTLSGEVVSLVPGDGLRTARVRRASTGAPIACRHLPRPPVTTDPAAELPRAKIRHPRQQLGRQNPTPAPTDKIRHPHAPTTTRTLPTTAPTTTRLPRKKALLHLVCQPRDCFLRRHQPLGNGRLTSRARRLRRTRRRCPAR